MVQGGEEDEGGMDFEEGK
jgi:hypothetical protein